MSKPEDRDDSPGGTDGGSTLSRSVIEPAANFDPLFTPFQLGGLTLRNRVVMSPMSIHVRWSPEEIADVAAHFRRRAEGGVSLIMSGATLVDHPTAGDESLGLTTMYGESLKGWAAVVREVHDVGVPMMAQLWHAGAWRDPAQGLPPDVPNFSPSGIGGTGEKVGAPATQAEIDAVIQGFVRSAVNAKSIGFDGVEVAAAYGYLIDQFFWSQRNQRDDQYGGSVENRSRFGAEVIAAVRQAVGPNFPISMRISQVKRDDFAASTWQTPQEMESALAPLVRAGVSIFHCGAWRFWLPVFPDETSPLSFAGWVKKVTGAPVILVGSVGMSKMMGETFDPGALSDVSNLDKLSEAMERGDFDLVAVGRALLADPEWPRKIREGRVDELKAFVRNPTMSSHAFSAHQWAALAD